MPAGRSSPTSAPVPASPSSRSSALGAQDNTTAFAYQGIIGVGYNIDSQFRVNLEGRYYGTSTPTLQGQGFQNNNLIAMLQLQMKFGAPAEAAAPPPAPAAPQAPSFMVFFDWDRSDLSEQALATIRQAAGSYKTKGSCAHHRDGPYRQVGSRRLQHGAVAAPREHGQGCAGP